jgi:hypothetical protein
MTTNTSSTVDTSSSYLSMAMGGDYGYSIPTAGSSTGIAPIPPSLPLGVGGSGSADGSSTLASGAFGGKEVLFEITGYPHCVPQELGHGECKCIFAVAKPYPSRNTAM